MSARPTPCCARTPTETDGVEVVVGLVETHARAKLALLEGLDVLPRLEVDYRGKMLKEFDLDAALARKPRVIIVDELAHSNPEGFRHPKRYQDIEELISAGSMSGRRSISSILKAFRSRLSDYRCHHP